MIKKATCKNCGWVSFIVTRAKAMADVIKFNRYYNTLSLKKQQDYYGGRKAAIKEYEVCFFCGSSYKNFRAFKKGDCPDGCTLNPIVDKKE